jgi:hypothetical protein
MATSG